MRNIPFIALLFSLLTVSGCATQLAKPINQKIDNNPSLMQVKNNVESYQNTMVRWGGAIAGTFNEEQNTLIEIVSRPLDAQGRPRESDDTQGRFIARVNGFLDPVVFSSGRELTVVGKITGHEKRMIDSYEYDYVTVAVDTFKLWPVIDKRQYNHYDPFWYGPWYPYYRWPYHYPRWHRHKAK